MVSSFLQPTCAPCPRLGRRTAAVNRCCQRVNLPCRSPPSPSPRPFHRDRPPFTPTSASNPSPCLIAPPRSLRALYGTDGTRNATHGSDSPASAEREIKFFFPHLIVDDAPPLKHFEALQPALLEALTALAKSKMGTTTAETLKFVGEYLLAHNPNKPKVMLPGTWKAVNGPNADDLL